MSGKSVTIYTDGACTGNPGPGGYCAILEYGEHRRELSGGFRRTTNNRMELMAVIKALEALKEPCQVTVVSDSEYVVNGVTKGWAKGWRAKGWRRQGKTVPNWDLWSRLLELCEFHRVKFEWVRGHAGHAAAGRAGGPPRVGPLEPHLRAGLRHRCLRCRNRDSRTGRPSGRST